MADFESDVKKILELVEQIRRILMAWVVNLASGVPAGNMSNLLIPEDALIGSPVGVASVTNGFGTYTPTLTDDAGGVFDLSGDTVVTAALLDFETEDEYEIEITFDNGVHTPIVEQFTITVTDVAEGTSPAPVVANQTLAFGALTKAGQGGYAPVNTGSAPTSASITSGDASGHWQVTAEGILSPSTTGDTANLNLGPYTLGMSFTNGAGSDTATFTVNITADRWTVANIAEADALTWTNAVMGGKGVLFRGPLKGGPVMYAYGRQPPATDNSAPWLRNRAYTALVTLSAADITDMPVVDLISISTVDGIGRGSMMRSIPNVRFEYIDFRANWNVAFPVGTGLTLSACLVTSGGGTIGTSWYRCNIQSDDLEAFPTSRQGFRGLFDIGNMQGGARVKFEECTIHGTQRLLNVKTANADGGIDIINNEFYDFGTDCIVFAGTSRVAIRGNYFHSSLLALESVAHSDICQWTGGTPDVNTVEIYGNVVVTFRLDDITGRKNTAQGFFFDDAATTDTINGAKIYNNLIVTNTNHAIAIRAPVGCYVWRNTLVCDTTTIGDADYPWILERETDAGGIPANNSFTYNFCSSIFPLYPGSNTVETPNIETAAANYSTYFTGTGFDDLAGWLEGKTKAQIIANFTPQAAYTAYGAVGAHTDFDAGTVDTTGHPWP